MLSGAFGDERAGEQRRRRGSRERERRSRGSRASPWRREEVGEAATAKQEVEASACARACGVCPSGREEDDRGGWRWAGLARWAWWAAEVSPGKVSLLYLLFLFCFSFLILQFVFDLI